MSYMNYDDIVSFSELLGKTIVRIDGHVGGEAIDFTLDTGQRYQLSHQQDCCESVEVEDIAGDFDDLLNSPVLLAEESTSDENPEGVTPEYQESFTWTFYRLATVKGYVTIRWYGQSNGYYSESVDFFKIPA